MNDTVRIKAPLLWKHQEHALAQLARNIPLALHWGMGTGKTRNILAITDNPHLRKSNAPVLVLCPASVVRVWEQEHKKWAVNSTLTVLTTNTCTRTFATAVQSPTPQLLVCSYDSFWRQPLRQRLLSFQYSLLVCDESHRLKNPQTKRARAMWALRDQCQQIVIMSGTMLTCDPGDLWMQYKVLHPDIFPGKRVEFEQKYGLAFDFYSGKPTRWNMGGILQATAPYTLRARTEDCHDLPEQHDLYHVHAPILYEYPSADDLLENGEPKYANTLALLTAQWMWCARDDDRADALRDLLTDLEPQQLVITAQHHAAIDAIATVLYPTAHKFVIMDSRHDSLQAERDWLDKKADILIVQYAKSEGANWQGNAHRMIHYELPWSYTDYTQIRGRIYRPGQQKRCIYHHIVQENTLDVHILDALQKKMDFAIAFIEDTTRGIV